MRFFFKLENQAEAIRLIENNANVDLADEYGQRPIIYATEVGMFTVQNLKSFVVQDTVYFGYVEVISTREFGIQKILSFSTWFFCLDIIQFNRWIKNISKIHFLSDEAVIRMTTFE